MDGHLLPTSAVYHIRMVSVYARYTPLGIYPQRLQGGLPLDARKNTIMGEVE
jgi:hypothetical protein